MDWELWRHATLGHIPPSLFSYSSGVQSHHTCLVTTFRVAPFQLGVQSHHVFSFMTFRVVSLSLTFTAIVSAWRSKPPCPLSHDVQSCLFQLGVQSRRVFSFMTFRVISLSLTFLAISSQLGVWSHRFLTIRHLDSPYLHFGVRHLSLVRHSELSHHLSVWCSEPHFCFGVQSHHSFSIWRSEPHCHLGV